ncbi:MAG: glycosyltransferase family 2 protein, partial [Patescibacteria group bacterium]
MKSDNCSIIVCTYNRLEYLKKCISSLLEIDFPTYEIVIVNDGSTDGTKEFLNSQYSRNKKITVVHHKQNKGLSQARNTGIKTAKYDIVIFTDDDCKADKNWLTQMLKGFSDEKVGLVMGQVFYVDKNYHGYFPERLVSNIDALWPMGCNVAYRKEVFKKCGYFDDFFFPYNNEDAEMALRTIKNGYRYAQLPKAVIYHQKIDWNT